MSGTYLPSAIDLLLHSSTQSPGWGLAPDQPLCDEPVDQPAWAEREWRWMRGPESTVERKMRDAYHADSALDAEAPLTALARELDKTHPRAAGLREGLAETLTMLRLGVPPTLARTLRSNLMDREYARPLDVSALAQAALMSPTHFSRQFRAANGETPYSYLMTRRVERAKALLRRGDLTVTEVCLAADCTSLGSFSSRLTELVGDSPTAYRGSGQSACGSRGDHPV